MSSSSETSRLIPRSSQGSDFQQQGTVDWGNISKSTVSFTVDALNRYSKAGVEVITVLGARAIFSQAKLSVIGEERIQNALDKTQAFPTLNKALWLGFGTKHIIHSLREHREGLACIGICAALVEMYSTSFSERVLQELFQLYNPPADFTPALRQWVALVEACAGVLAPTEFGLILHQMSKVFLYPDQLNLCFNPSAASLARTLKALFDVSNGSLDKLLLTGGSDCAWIATVSHWILGLSTEVQDGNANIIYRPGVHTTDRPALGTQVVVLYDKSLSQDSIELLSRCYVIRSGRDLFHTSDADILCHGRVSWNTCLVDTFGRPMSRLLGPLAPITGTCIGTMAKVVASLRGAGDHVEAELATVVSDINSSRFRGLVINSASTFRGFFNTSRDILPELLDSPQLIQAMEETAGLSLNDSVQRYRVAMSSLEAQCACRYCHHRCTIRSAAIPMHGEANAADHEVDPSQYCLLALVHVIGNLVRTAASCSLPRTQAILPTRSGIEMMYKNVLEADYGGRHLDPAAEDVWGAFRTLLQKTAMAAAQQLYIGSRQFLSDSDLEGSAAAQDGLCFCIGTLSKITRDPIRAGTVNIVPVTIQWNGFHYKNVVDAEGRHGQITVSNVQYPAEKQVAVDDLSSHSLAGSASDKLEASLFVQESSERDRVDHLIAIYTISRRGAGQDSFLVGPAEISARLQRASRIPRKSCH
ncbi:hypothetical protein QBC34DRAFT_414886 [Podospora aff. communis PSN243]|uniref:Uncharacterized protein n=1 Tax=Podospora aff. communis PSN243 TaxID=3040156 RepID=A0AAV9G9S0_9PEZI|nr:hypothetical protein QBC34DRAFT_414886 [Podospora aff. communis PSN243]